MNFSRTKYGVALAILLFQKSESKDISATSTDRPMHTLKRSHKSSTPQADTLILIVISFLRLSKPEELLLHVAHVQEVKI